MMKYSLQHVDNRFHISLMCDSIFWFTTPPTDIPTVGTKLVGDGLCVGTNFGSDVLIVGSYFEVIVLRVGAI